ncbi:hypothetical protein Calla_1633 [Caldicellulosiruptor acetigenus 6A]|uniref:Uncharacterized protein n=1 Tax=Caldicellulosiruptor acetigenus 6A TaxID=632516 RepID=G2PT75_9FIRM|nr:hypothetical protein Calla_1633 [Caldicellulosiruptor acetigenus 6A]
MKPNLTISLNSGYAVRFAHPNPYVLRIPAEYQNFFLSCPIEAVRVL